MNELFESFAHFAVKTKDIDESIAFYEKIGGRLYVKEVLSNRKLALIRFSNVVIELIENGQEFVSNGAIAHCTFYVKNVKEAGEILKEKGIVFNSEEPIKVDVFGGIENWFFNGPSGELIELLHMNQKI